MKNTVLLPFQKQAIQDLISQYPSQPKIAERFLAAFFKAHKKLGGRDRKLIASLFYTWIKNMLFIDALELNDSESLLSLLGQLARKQSEEKKAFLEEIANQHGIQDWAIWYSMPTWIAHKLEDYYPEVFQEISFSFLEEGNTFLRFNESKLDGKQKEQIISNEELQINKHPNGIGFISSARNLVRSEAFQQGLFEIQDYGSQQIGLFTKVKAGEQVIDACCGAGGKALQMADMMQDTGKIWCLDIRMKALEEASNRADRAGFECLEFYEIPKNPEEVDFPFIAD
ncbi:MAG: class I SAM-dependent methyltransferase, partial [Luteibaculum sp.]